MPWTAGPSASSSSASSQSFREKFIVEEFSQPSADGFGCFSMKLHKPQPAPTPDQKCFFLIWLHGMDKVDIGQDDLASVQQHLGRPTYFLVPRSPDRCGPLGFYWSVAYTREQNTNDLGFVFGQPHTPFLERITADIRSFKERLRPSKVLLMGYSMGGFGAIQLGCHAPDLFDAVISVAGYGLGTREPVTSSYHPPQPRSSEIFDAWVSTAASQLRQVSVVCAVHAKADKISSFEDVNAILAAIREAGGDAFMLEVPADKANSSSKARKKNGHSYYDYAVLGKSGKDFFYQVLLDRLDAAQERATADKELATADKERLQKLKAAVAAAER